jgi:integrase
MKREGYRQQDDTYRGQMAPFNRDDLQLIRAKLKAQHAWRDLAMLNVGVDTMLRASDLVRLRVNELRDHHGEIIDKFVILQTKTREPVHLGLTDGREEKSTYNRIVVEPQQVINS